MSSIAQIASIIEAGEFEHYGLRAHRGCDAIIGETLGKSRVWVDGECTDDELDGICVIEAKPNKLEAIVSMIHQVYAWGGEAIVLVGGNVRQWGEDDGEIIIQDNVCLAIIE